MKNLILVLFAIVTFSFGINAQDLSFKSFDKNLKPKGELVVVEKWNDREDYYYQELGEYSITEWWFYYNPVAKKVEEARSKQAFYDELDLDNVSITPDSSGKYVYVEIKTKKEKEVTLNITYQSDEYTKYTFSSIKFVAKNQKDADALVAKLKEKAFDMSLDLDAEIERVSPINHSLKFSEEFPDGADRDQVEAAKNGGGSSAKSESKDADEEETTTTKTNTNSSNNTASNNSTPKAKTEIWLKLWNKSDGIIEIAYEARGAGGSRTQTSINQRSTKSVKMKIGGRVFGANGAVLLTVTADMEDTEQVIFQ
jgi:hypothetical protein